MDELFHYRNIGKVIMPHSVLLIGSDWSLLEGGFPFLFRGRSLFLLEGGAFFWIWHLSAPQGNPACTLSHLDLSSGPFTELTSPCTTLCNLLTYYIRRSWLSLGWMQWLASGQIVMIKFKIMAQLQTCTFSHGVGSGAPLLPEAEHPNRLNQPWLARWQGERIE